MGILTRHQRIFITGTDTGVGKTYFACRLIRHLAGKGIRVGVMKPIETGILSEEKSDGYLLRKAAESKLPLEMISPYRFKTPASPRAASLKEKKTIHVRKIIDLYQKLSLAHEWMIVEGAGGVLVPILKQFDTADLIQSLKIPLILVAPQKLGTINQTLLSIHLAKTRGLNLLAVVLNQKRSKRDNLSILSNKKIIEENCDLPVLAFQSSGLNERNDLFWKRLLD
jgi:dethiobiotin synthetase